MCKINIKLVYLTFIHCTLYFLNLLELFFFLNFSTLCI